MLTTTCKLAAISNSTDCISQINFLIPLLPARSDNVILCLSLLNQAEIKAPNLNKVFVPVVLYSIQRVRFNDDADLPDVRYSYELVY